MIEEYEVEVCYSQRTQGSESDQNRIGRNPS